MDTDMTDAAYDIDIDVNAEPISVAPPPQQIIEQDIAATDGIPEAYLEDIKIEQPWPESLNIQGVSDFDPNDPLYYAIEHCGAEPRVKQLRWVNDSSVNLEFYSAQDAAVALGILTHQDVGNPGSLSKQEPRKAKPYSKTPNSVLLIRESNAGDQKPKGAANRSNYYKHNPDVAGNRQREPRRKRSPPPRRDFLDYGDDDMGSRQRSRRRSSGDNSMNGDSGADRRRPRRDGRDNRGDRDNRGRDTRGRGGRLSRGQDAGRLNQDVDSYRPGSKSPQESRFGRLRGRSASPASDEEGDGRFGFAEELSHAGRRRYRSRSRSRNTRRRQEPSSERWTHDRANHDRTSSGRWQKDSALLESSPMGNHRRSDAMDKTGSSLLARMTKDGQPMLPQQKRSLADRITRDDDNDDMWGRLKNDNRDPWVSDFSEPTKARRGLADRITRDKEINIRGRGQEGINIRGSASSNGGSEGINIRGVASGA